MFELKLSWKEIIKINKECIQRVYLLIKYLSCTVQMDFGLVCLGGPLQFVQKVRRWILNKPGSVSLHPNDHKIFFHSWIWGNFNPPNFYFKKVNFWLNFLEVWSFLACMKKIHTYYCQITLCNLRKIFSSFSISQKTVIWKWL